VIWAAVLLMLAQVPDGVKSEPNLEKRFLLAFDVAGRAIDDARKAYGEGDAKAVRKAADDAAAAVEYALATLEGMGKPPYKNGGNYKKAELRSREILRRFDTLIKDAVLEDREALEKPQARVAAVHDKLLEGVMSKKP
jgi:hypothetical protein